MILVKRSADKALPKRLGDRFAGFSLVEVMVAIVIGMLGIIVMMQMFSVFEGQKRTTTGGDDSISSGAIALYGVQRDIQQSGWGISALGGSDDVSLMGCTVAPDPAFGSDFSASPLPLVPVTINSALITGQAPNTDTLLIVSGNTSGSVEGDELTGLAVKTPKAFNATDRVVSVPFSGACNARVLGKFSLLNFDTGGVRLYNLGANPTVRGYAIRSGNLTTCNFITSDCVTAANNTDPSIWVPIANNVVSLRAEYGRDTTISTNPGSSLGSLDGVIDVWDQTVATTATPVSTNAKKNTTACAWARVAAVRIALVARSSQTEKLLDSGAHLTAAAPLWVGSDAVAHGIDTTEADAVAINLGGVPCPAWPNWCDYRYKVFQTVVPLRNVTSTGVSVGVVPKC